MDGAVFVAGSRGNEDLAMTCPVSGSLTASVHDRAELAGLMQMQALPWAASVNSFGDQDGLFVAAIYWKRGDPETP